ncbi:MAG: hypothetical protein ACREA0_16510 [bacterium]
MIRSVNYFPHAPRVHPVDGTAACWARSCVTSQSPRGPGVLTAKHVLTKAAEQRSALTPNSVTRAPQAGDRFPLSNGRTGTILQVASEGIDAALIDTGERGQSARLPFETHVAPWTDIEFVGATACSHFTKITAVTDTRGIFNSPALPARVLLGAAGHPGDSGALVRRQHSGPAIAIYMGGYRDAAGGTGGIGQHLGQVTEVMDMEVYL